MARAIPEGLPAGDARRADLMDSPTQENDMMNDAMQPEMANAIAARALTHDRERQAFVADLAQQALTLKHRIHGLYKALAQIEEALKDNLKDGERIVTPTGTVLLLETQAVHFTDVEAVQRALGSGFSRLVKVEQVYEPDPALFELAGDASSPLGESLRAGLTLQRRRSLLYNFRSTPLTANRSTPPAKPYRSTPHTASGND